MAKAKRKKRKKSAKKKARAPKRAAAAKRRPGRPPAAAASGSGVVAILTTARNELLAQRDMIERQLTKVEDALNMAGGRGAGPGRRGGRPAAGGPGRHGRRAGSLKEYIAQSLSAAGGPMAVKDITDDVLRSGYPTRNKTLAKSVGIALTQMPEVQKVGRGLFQMK
jgi:hypothetical protein